MKFPRMTPTRDRNARYAAIANRMPDARNPLIAKGTNPMAPSI
jgi:hypothetical protein